MNLEETESLSEQIVKYISEQIISGELVEGERIQELRIAKELDVSRGSVREALLLLERTHLIEIFSASWCNCFGNVGTTGQSVV
ncbi:Putative transcriptional regulator [Acinetobacter baumannii]|nr:Putative transcriptional regulator [Acinetobacter baumannii]